MTNQDFESKVLEIVKQIPRSKVCTYGIIAHAIGLKSSARMVGWILNKNRQNDEIPFHRVVNRNGDLTGKFYFDSPSQMEDLLLSEGIEFIKDRVNLNKHLWIP